MRYFAFIILIKSRFSVSNVVFFFLKGTPLFDGSCRFIDPQTIQSLQQCHLLLSNLSTVLSCFATEAHDITERGVLLVLRKWMFHWLLLLDFGTEYISYALDGLLGKQAIISQMLDFFFSKWKATDVIRWTMSSWLNKVGKLGI